MADLNCTGGVYHWALQNGRIIIYPDVPDDANIIVYGPRLPGEYELTDIGMEIAEGVGIGSTQVGGLDRRLMKLVRYRVLARMAEDNGKYDLADRFESKCMRLERELTIYYEDPENRDFTGNMKVSDG